MRSFQGSLFAYTCSVLMMHSFGEAPDEWVRIAKAELEGALKLSSNTNRAKNIVIFVGDGMGLSTVTAGRIYKGQQTRKNGERTELVFENFPHVALSKTYTDDYQTPDSAGTATAMFCGQKTASGVVGVNSRVKRGDCETVRNNSIDSVFLWAQEARKATGIVTTTRITHATPAATYAHSADREWDADVNMPVDARGVCKDIARQLIEDAPGRNMKVVLGGARGKFYPANYTDPLTGKQGERLDGVNLVDEWIRREKLTDRNAFKFVSTRKELLHIPKSTSKLLGLFSASHMEYELRREKNAPLEPTLLEMAEMAVRILSRDKDGFLLLVEGGKIDLGHHDGMARVALQETLMFDRTIERVLKLVNLSETLIIVTADHSHTLTINGYPKRGTNILGLTGELADDNLPYTTLQYANGAGNMSPTRRNLTDVDTTDINFKQDAPIPLKGVGKLGETHGGEDVGIWAIGPFSHLFHGTHEQHYIAHVMDYAACYTNKSPLHCR